MPPIRPDETYFRLHFWTYASTLSERLAGHLIAAEGYQSVDPSCPLGGPDQGADAMCLKDGKKWVMASWFPYGPHGFPEVKKKLLLDVGAARHREPDGVVFVCNQKITPGDRKKLQQAVGSDVEVDFFHLERNVHILDRTDMAQIREQYIYIPAADRPAISVRAEIAGLARTFTEEEHVLEFFVELYEKEVREESDKGWARVKGEEARRARVEAEKAAKARREAAEARARAGKPASFLDSGFNFPDLNLASNIRIPGFESATTPPWMDQIVAKQYGYEVVGEAPPPPEPLSDEQIEQKVAAYRAELESRWPVSKEYLASTAWPGLGIRLTNLGGYVPSAQIILTFHGAKGVDFRDMEDFEYQKLEDPSWVPPPPSGPAWMAAVTPVPMPRRARDNRVFHTRHNDDGDLEITITLPELRPRQVWSSDTDDVVLVLADADLEGVQVTYTVTAADYHEAVDGDPIAVPVDRVSMWEAFVEAYEASRRAS